MQTQKLPIHEWAIDDRPREKLLSKGPAALSDSELLAILIKDGYGNQNALDLGKEVLRLGNNNLNELGKVPVAEMMKIKGIGQAKAVTIAAALEMGRRRQASQFMSKPVVRNSKDIALYLQSLFCDLRHEIFAVIFLNHANRINHFEIISEGGITATIADPRVILKKALEQDAVSLILCHNHPSGSLKPSRADEDLTRRIKEAAAYFDISILDHIIVSEMGHYSFADEGKL